MPSPPEQLSPLSPLVDFVTQKPLAAGALALLALAARRRIPAKTNELILSAFTSPLSFPSIKLSRAFDFGLPKALSAIRTIGVKPVSELMPEGSYSPFTIPYGTADRQGNIGFPREWIDELVLGGNLRDRYSLETTAAHELGHAIQSLPEFPPSISQKVRHMWEFPEYSRIAGLDKEVFPTRYSRTSPEELFADLFAYRLLKLDDILYPGPRRTAASIIEWLDSLPERPINWLHR